VVDRGDEFVRARRELEDEWGFQSFHDALRSWIATVAIIEVEYVGEWEEYTHDLMARDYLDELARRSPAEWASHIETEVAPWDQRFRAATVQEHRAHLPPLEGEPGWWQYRSPRRWKRPASEELERRASDTES
jgi:hypothetical protein